MQRMLVLVVFACGGKDREPTPAPTVEPAEEVAVDEPAVLEDDILVVPATLQGRTYELRFGKGRVLLSLADGTLVAPGPATGEIALESLAKWLGVAVPPKTHSQPLTPISFKSYDLGENKYKVFFERGAEYAEMYINIRDPKHLEFVPKDSEYAGPLADMFADALRDGPAPPRSTKTDPSLATEQPLLVAGRELDADDVHEPVCFDGGFVVFRPTQTNETALFAPWGGDATRLCELPGAVDQVLRAPRSPHVLAMVTARDPRSGVIGGKQTATLWSVSPSQCRQIPTPKDLAMGPFVFPALSPTGTDVAVINKTELVTFPVGKGKSSRTKVNDLDLIYAWDADGIQLHDLEAKRSRMQPGQPPARIEHHTATSPDGAFVVTLRDTALDVLERASGKTRTFQPSYRSDMRAIARAAIHPLTWLGPRTLILRGNPDLALDLVTLRTRPLGDSEVLCTSPDGKHALMTTDEALFESK